MIRSRSWLAILLVAAAVIGTWVAVKKKSPPELSFTKATRETLVSSLSTNGKVEPIEWMPVRSERAGVITRVSVSKGQFVRKGDPLVELDTRVASADLSKSQAAIQEAQAQEQVLTQGGRVAERQQIEADLARARLDLDAAQKNHQALERLVAKQAATRQELDSARQLVDQLELRIQALEKNKAALVTGTDQEIAKARLREAESTAAVAQTNLDLSVIRAPMDGTAYDFDLKQGSYVNPGDPIAKVGRLDRVRVTVYVDEPDLGRGRLRDRKSGPRFTCKRQHQRGYSGDGGGKRDRDSEGGDSPAGFGHWRFAAGRRSRGVAQGNPRHFDLHEVAGDFRIEGRRRSGAAIGEADPERGAGAAGFSVGRRLRLLAPLSISVDPC